MEEYYLSDPEEGSTFLQNMTYPSNLLVIVIVSVALI
jgi:hypothetical protein